MRLVDTSVWIDFLRGNQSPATAELRRQLGAASPDVAMCEPIAMELLAGATSEVALVQLERLCNGLPQLELDPALDFRGAATLFRNARRGGFTVRSLNDCLIASVALRHDAVVVHKDVDFEVLARFTRLRTESLR
jgi:predicted nucleic acid-binding protein